MVPIIEKEFLSCRDLKYNSAIDGDEYCTWPKSETAFIQRW